MELTKIEELLEKYFEGNSNEAEEQVLKSYFLQENVAPHLQEYKSLFGFFDESKKIQSERKFTYNNVQNRQKNRRWFISIAASFLVAIGTGVFMFSNFQFSNQEDLGTYDDPEIALKETQKALTLLSKHINTGYESVQVIEEFENTKNKVFNLDY